MQGIKIVKNGRNFILKKEGPVFFFAYNEDGVQCGFGKTIEETIERINEEKALKWNSLSQAEKNIRNASRAFELGHLN